MFDLDTSLQKQLSQGAELKQVLVFPESEDPRVIEAASRLVSFANVILVGNPREVTALLDYGACRLACSRDRFSARVLVVDPKGEEQIRRELAEELCALGAGRQWAFSPEQAAEKVLNPVYFGVMLVRRGYADAVLGGVTHSSRDFLVPCLHLLEGQGTAFEMGLFALPDEEAGPLFRQNIVMFADVALNMQPTPEQLADIAVQSCQTMRDIVPIQVLPEINGTLVSYSTKGSGQGPSVERIRAAEPLIEKKLTALKASNQAYESININTEFQISVAISENAAKGKLENQFKMLHGAGKANVLIVPSLDEGNMLYHLYSTRYPKAQSTLIMGGMKHQALDFSRSSTPEQIARGAQILMLCRQRSAHYRPTPKDYFFPRRQVLTINPGSTSTKVALYEGEQVLFEHEETHHWRDLSQYSSIWDQLEIRGAVVDRVLREENTDLSRVRAVVGQAGLLPDMEAGTYQISPDMLVALVNNSIGEHASNLGAPLALRIAIRLGVPAYVADAPTIDERDELAKAGGSCIWHALSQKTAARRYAEELNREYQDCNFIVAHLGSGISIGAHRMGRCVQVNNALYDGPMAPVHAGRLPTEALIELCYSGLDKDELKELLSQKGGLASHLGAADMSKVAELAGQGDAAAARLLSGMAEQIAREIASLTAKFRGQRIDRIILTGGLCRCTELLELIRHSLVPLGLGITVYEGSMEMEALRDVGLRAVSGLEQPKSFPALSV